MSMDPNEITKIIDGVYKNILENFNPASRHVIATGKAYLKALHGASAACSMYLESLEKLSTVGKQSSLGCSGDIGSSLMQVTDTFKEIHTQQLNTLKAFYVDFLVPLEANIEKDTRVIQNEQKQFLLSHKNRFENFSKASCNVKKMKKKTKKCNSSTTIDREIKVIQTYEEEKTKMETFCEQSLNEALIHERRRYGFILERQASLGRHYLAFYSKGNSLLSQKLDNWIKVAKTRDILPEHMQKAPLGKIIRQGTEEDCIYCTPRRPNDDMEARLRKTKSMDVSEILGEEPGFVGTPPGFGSLNRAKSELNLVTNGLTPENVSALQEESPRPREPSSDGNHRNRPKSLAIATDNNFGVVKALYAYLSNGENQLCFHEGDLIGLIGERNKGWQYGENLRTGQTGWFPITYTGTSESGSPGSAINSSENHGIVCKTSPAPPPIPPPGPNSLVIQAPVERRIQHAQRQQQRPASMFIPKNHQFQIKSPSSVISPIGINVSTSTQTGTQSDSLHSSNDSGISNDVTHGIHHQHHRNTHYTQQQIVPIQPEIDYSDDEPQSSGTLKPGDKWLMEKYQKLESERLNQDLRKGADGRRSLSFINVSEVGRDCDDDEVCSTLQRGRPRHRQYPPTQNNKTTRSNSNTKKSTEIHRDGNALKKLLNRTKSLIFKRDPTPPPKLPPKRSTTITQPKSVSRERFDSVSVMESCYSEDIWASHASLIGIEPRILHNLHPPPPSYNVKEPGEHNKKHSTKIEEVNTGPVGPPKKCVNAQSQTDEQPRIPLGKYAPPPIPPPLPSHDKLNQTYSNLNELAIAKQQSKNESVAESSNNEAKVLTRRSKNTFTNNRKQPSETGSIRRTESEKIRPSAKGLHRRVLRVESFSGSEAPIVPTTQSSRGGRKLRNTSDYATAGLIQSKGKFSSKVSSVNSESYDEDEKTIDDDESSIFLEVDIEEEDEENDTVVPSPQPPPPPRPPQQTKSKAKSISTFRSIGNNSSKNGRLPIIPRNVSPDPSISKMSSIVDAEELINTRNKKKRRFKGSIRSEVHTMELIATEGESLPLFQYGNQIHKRLYYPERSSRMDQKSERTGNLCGPWYDLWGVDPSVVSVS